VTWNTQALGFTSQGPPVAPSFLSCPDAQDPGAKSSGPPDRLSAAHRPTLLRRKQHVSTAPRRSRPWTVAADTHGEAASGSLVSAEILEAACNASIPGLTGVSNFTVFLYCNLFEAENGSGGLVLAEVGPDLHATCSDAAWYLSAAEEDFLWVNVCSEFFAHEFNNTVCANSSFWSQRAHQVREELISIPSVLIVLQCKVNCNVMMAISTLI